MTSDIKTYSWVVFFLMLLLGAALGVTYLPLGAFSPVVAVFISIVKTFLIVLFFMHVKHAKGVIKLFAGAGFVWLIILIGLTMTDYLFRTDMHIPSL